MTRSVGGLGRNPLTEPDENVGHVHPVISVVQFAKVARETGGATMNVHTGEVFRGGTPGAPGARKWVIGGATDLRTGERVPTTSSAYLYDENGPTSDVDLSKALQERRRARVATGMGNPEASMGVYDAGQAEHDPKPQMEWDAVDTRNTRRQGDVLGTARNERDIFGMKYSRLRSVRRWVR